LQWYNLYLRAMGTQVGPGVACMGGVVAEYEQVDIGEGAVINEGSFLLTHTVENRCAKIRPISIGKRVTVGCLCAVLPDASMSDGSSLGDMSLVSVL
jgi:acetyltransferase-like isoleucine patch superfamily enzyme